MPVLRQYNSHIFVTHVVSTSPSLLPRVAVHALFCQRDLLTDKKVVGTFGDGTARFTAATAAAAERAAAAANAVNTSSNPAPSAVSWRAEEESGKGREAVDQSGRLAGFLSTVLKGLVDAEDKHQVRQAWVTGWFGVGLPAEHPLTEPYTRTFSTGRSVKADAGGSRRWILSNHRNGELRFASGRL